MAKKIIEKTIIENINTESLDELMGNRYAVYAKYVIQDRAIPDARDGLKPVQRRIIYSMYINNYTIDRSTIKCAKIVGDVMGRFHPHGDTSIYDTLVRMSQPWKMSMPLIDFQGNNGSTDNDPAAAYRYTEARLNKFAMNLIADLNKETVDKTLNFDDSEFEPIVLPAKFPNLFVNGSEGIAVAIATEIPPHNLNEMCEAAIYRLVNPKCSVEELFEIIKGPDFPTGGIIYNTESMKDIYRTGRGKVEISSKVEIKKVSDGYQLVITEIPYNVVKQQLVYSIDKIKKSHDVDGIIEVRDLSSGDGTDIVVDIKKDANPEIILAYLFNKTQLRISYSANVVAICNKHPRTLNLLEYLDIYLEHQKDVITRRSTFDYNKSTARLHIVDGLIKSVSIIDEIIKIIKASIDKADAKKNLINAYHFSDLQAEAIVNMRLYRLSNTDVKIYLEEKAELEELVKDLRETLDNPSKLKKIIANDLKNVIKEYSTERRTKVEQELETTQIDKRDLIVKEDLYVAITRDGYIKTSSIKSYKASDTPIPGMKTGDNLVMSMIVNNMDYILAFTNLGNYLFLPVHEIQETRWKDEGKHVNYMANLPLNEHIVKCILVKDFEKNVSIGIVSKNGQIKKTLLKEFFAQRYSKAITCMKLSRNDEVADVSVLSNDSDLLIVTKNGLATYFNENQFSRTGLKTSGVKAMSSLKHNEIVSLLAFNAAEKNKIIFITNKAMYRIFDRSNLNVTQRLGARQTIFKSFKSDIHNLVYSQKLVNKENDLILYTQNTGNEIIPITIDDFHLTPMEKYCKKNILSYNDSDIIQTIFQFEAQVIDENTVVNTLLIQENTTNQNSNEENSDDDSENGYEQISIFDDMGD